MEFGLLNDIVIIFALSTLVNFLFTRLKIPTILGYLLTGIVAGPHVAGLVGDSDEIGHLAEIGVVLLMFTIGMEFSLNHLFRIRRVVFLGGFVQVAATTGVILLVSRFYQLGWQAGLFVGFMTALSSTAIVLKVLQERSELTSNFGRTVVGILVFQDIVIIPLLIFAPMLSGKLDNQMTQLAWMFAKSAGILVLVYTGHKWIVPKALHLVAMTRNQELFLMSVFSIGLGVALLTSQLGMSLAFGAFLAGLMISGSHYSHHAFGHLIPFKDTFTSFFFVSIGTLLDVNFVLAYPGLIGISVALVVFLKTFVGGGTAFMLGHTFRGTVIIGLALSQVGEFSFLLAKLGLDYAIISDFHYQLFLSVAIVTMALTPFLIRSSKYLATAGLRLPLPKRIVEGLFPLRQIEIPRLEHHVVFIGKDARTLNMSRMARQMKLPYVSIVFDPAIAQQRQQKGEMVVYGDAVNTPILEKAYVGSADVVVVSIGDLIVSMAVVANVRNLNRSVHILVRTRHVDDIEELYRLGANQVIPEEFETSINLFERVMKRMQLPVRKIQSAIGRIRDDHYGLFREIEDKSAVALLKELPGMEITAVRIEESSLLAGKSLADSNLRSHYGVTVVALMRDGHLMEHPAADTMLVSEDTLYIMGKPEQVAGMLDWFQVQSD